MIVKKPADLDPAMKLALKNHIMRKRQQLKQELEQDAIEKRLKREQEAKRRQDAMTLDQIKEQLHYLQRTLDTLKNEKHTLFAQLKQNMRISSEDDTRRKQKEGELNAVRQQNNDQNRLPQQQQQSQGNAISNGSISIANQENHVPGPKDKPHDLHSQQPQVFHQPLQQQQQQQHQTQPSQQQPLLHPPHLQSNHHEHESLQNNSHQLHHVGPHAQRPNSIFNSASAFTHILNAHSFPRQSPYLSHLPPSSRASNPYGPMSPYPPLSHHPPPSLLSGHGIPAPIPHIAQANSMIRPSPPPMSNAGPINTGPPKLPPLSLPITSSAPPTQIDFNPSLVNSTAHQMQQQAMKNSAAAAAAAAALGIPYGSHYFNSNSPIGPSITSHQALEHHAALNAAAVAVAAASNHNHLQGSGGNINNSGTNSSVNNASNNSSRGNPAPPTKRPISATSLTNETISPNKKIHTQPAPPQNHPLSASLSGYMGYPGLPPGLASAAGPALPAGLFGQNLMRTPPPPNISNLFNSAAFSQILNAHNFPRQSPYLSHLPQPNRASNPYGPMNPYQSLGHHSQPTLLPGHSIPTSLSHVSQSVPMIRPSPPPMSNPGQISAGLSKLPQLSLPISSGAPTQLDFNPNLVTSTAHHMQQQALSNSAAAARAAAAAAALGITGYGAPYFSSNSPIGPPSQF